MTPQEIFDYKLKWKMNEPYKVIVHSDKEHEGKDWCKEQVEPHKWDFVKWYNMYENIYLFEDKASADRFEQAMGRWVTKEE